MRSGLFASVAALTLGLAATPAWAGVQHAPLEDGVEGIYITGEIFAPDETAFRELADRYPQAVVYLDSPGGELVPGIEIGKLVRERGYATVVLEQSTCNSACALIWLAGTPRYLQGSGNLGFHASYSEEGGQLVETGVGNAIVGHYISQLGLEQDAVIFATSASPYEIMNLTAANSVEAGITFETSLNGVPQPNLAMLVDTSVLQKAQVAMATAPGKPEEISDPTKGRPPQIEREPDELTKAMPFPGKTGIAQ
jgi:hypothetical protein